VAREHPAAVIPLGRTVAAVVAQAVGRVRDGRRAKGPGTQALNIVHTGLAPDRRAALGPIRQVTCRGKHEFGASQPPACPAAIFPAFPFRVWPQGRAFSFLTRFRQNESVEFAVRPVCFLGRTG
jgi:hypothetical protein